MVKKVCFKADLLSRRTVAPAENDRGVACPAKDMVIVHINNPSVVPAWKLTILSTEVVSVLEIYLLSIGVGSPSLAHEKSNDKVVESILQVSERLWPSGTKLNLGVMATIGTPAMCYKSGNGNKMPHV